MHSRWRAALLAVAVAAMAAVVSACGGRGGGPLGTEYEYEEDLAIRLDGSATLVINASVPALVALRGLPLNTALNTRADELRTQLRSLYSSEHTRVGRISSWARRGRRFVGVHLVVDDIRALTGVAPLSWATYDLRQEGEQFVFRQTLSKPSSPGPLTAGLTGDEVVAFRLHIPARIRFQNSRYLEKDESRPAARGNIVTWEQRLRERLQGKPIAYAEDRTPDVMEARMDRQSILYRTLWLFGIAFVAAMLVIAALIWLTMRRGGKPEGAAG
ncbi:MAG TPA: hypothetical protein VFK57_15710 [Vicinamibacterales bacterium]|nr:hypothetical protein [Vicinamibacterales bacterium]